MSSEADLADKIERLRAAVERLRDVHRIQNLMSKLTYLNEVGAFEEILGHFAQKTPGVTVEIGKRGVFEGHEGARKTLVDIGNLMRETHNAGMKEAFPEAVDMAGFQENQALGSPMIEVAGDGKTAKGLWSAPASQTQFSPKEGRPAAFWVWIKFAVDFVKEDGEWKIWHYHLLPMFRTGFEESWVESSLVPLKPPPDFPEPDRPSTEYVNPYSIYTAPKYLPRPPEPYETFDDTFSY